MKRLPRKYQNQAVKDLINVFNKFPKDQRAFLKLPTGTGKTWTAFFFLREYYGNKKVKVVWAAHQNDLVNQAKSDLCEFMGIKDSPSLSRVKFGSIEIHFSTWQGLRTKNTTYDLLIIDEVHCGSSNSYDPSALKKEHKSFQAIMKLAPAHVYISATPWELNPELYKGLLSVGTKRDGTKVQMIKKERKTEYSLQQAYDDGVIVNTQFLCVQTVNTIKLKELESENSFNDIEDLAKHVKDFDINIKDIESRKSLNRAVLESMLDVYFTKEVTSGEIPQTMIFCKGKNGIDDSLTVESVVAAVKKLAIKHKKLLGIKLPSGKSLVRFATSSEKDSAEVLQGFKDREFPILCVVAMAREGYNAPPTEVLIDLSHSTKNMRLLVQKVGRGLRTFSGKILSRYYYPDNLNNYLVVRGANMQLNPEAKARVQDAILAANPDATPEIISAAEVAVLRAAEINDAISEGDSPAPVNFEGLEDLSKLKKDGKKESVVVTSTSLIIEDARNTNPLKHIDSSWLFDKLEVIEGEDRTNWEFFEALPQWRELVIYCINKGVRIEEAYNVWLQK